MVLWLYSANYLFTCFETFFSGLIISWRWPWQVIVGELCFCSGTELILLLWLLSSRVGDSLLPVHNHMLWFSWCFSVLCCFDESSPVELCIVIDWIGIIVDSWTMALQADWYTFHHIVFFDNLLLLLWVRFAIIVLSCVFFLPLRCQSHIELYYF